MLRMTSTLAVPAAVGFDRLHVACAPDLGSGCIHPVAAMIARVAGASLITRCVHTAPPCSPADGILQTAAADACGRPAGRQRRLPAGGPLDIIARSAREEGADLVAIPVSPGSESHTAAQVARRLLDAGIAVLAVPPLPDHRSQQLRLGIGHDGGRPGAAALAVAQRIAATGRRDVTRFDIAYVDDSASASCDADGDVVASRRGAVIEWWLAGLVEQVSAPVRTLRPVGDPASELAELSRDLDLLVIGTRGRAPLRRALTGSVLRNLLGTVRCPLLIVPPGLAAGNPAM
jgi:nucleotide-binding universal stress UspA family protein